MTEESGTARRRYTTVQLSRYWSCGEAPLVELPVPVAPETLREPLPPQLVAVDLPDWAADLSDGGSLLVPSRFVLAGPDDEWRRTDWWGAAFWFLNGLAERAFEKRHGPIHSYSFRLKGWDPRLWERAWVNRIALFLRRWAARLAHRDEVDLLGPLPEPRILVTHDVDAIRKTPAIRMKQSAFQALKALRSIVRGRFRRGLQHFRAAGRFCLASDDYWNFNLITDCEQRHGLRGHFNFYGAGGGWRRSLSSLLFDPGYDVRDSQLAALLRELHRRGWTVGLHQSFYSWHDPGQMLREKERVEASLGASIISCRQHWLRFSWERTWRAQQEAGFTLDTTLGFNDRAGFRNGAALQFYPWDEASSRPFAISSLPMMLMDSHLYDYADLDGGERQREMRYWIEEVHAVRGQASVIWHPHALAADYGWRPGFESFLGMVAEDRRS